MGEGKQRIYLKEEKKKKRKKNNKNINNKKKTSLEDTHDRVQRDGGLLVAEGAATVPLVGDTLCLLGHEVSNHVRRRSERGGNIA